MANRAPHDELLAPRNPFPSVLDHPVGATGSREPILKGATSAREFAAIERKIVDEIGDAMARLRARLDFAEARKRQRECAPVQTARSRAAQKWHMS
jgi:hypothetical protein